MLRTSELAGAPSRGNELDVNALKSFLNDCSPPVEFDSIAQFGYGQSNPTYLLAAESRRYVLRKKPPGQVLASAHAVEREYAIVSALAQTEVPVPAAYVLCEDVGVIGTPFYVMDFVDGCVFTDPSLPDLAPRCRQQVYASFASTLAALHSVDPAKVGLQGHGPPSGYCQRQVRRWSQQYKSSVVHTGGPQREVLALSDWLSDNIPQEGGSCSNVRLSHGDYRLDNLVFDEKKTGEVLAVLDWELSTLGDPMADLAYACLPYHLPNVIPTLPSLPKDLPEGVPSEAEFVASYSSAAGIPPPEPSVMAFYVALSMFRIAAILAGVGARAALGNASSAFAHQVGSRDVVASIAKKAQCVIADSILMRVPEPSAQQLPPPGSIPKLHTRMSKTRNHSGVEGKSQLSQTSPQHRSACNGSGSRASPSQLPSATLSKQKASGHCLLRRSPAAANSSQAHDDSPTGLGANAKTQLLLGRLQQFIAEHVEPVDHVLEEFHSNRLNPDRWKLHPAWRKLRQEAQSQGLWNLWMPHHLAQKLQPLQEASGGKLIMGAGLTNLEYGHLCEVMGRIPWASEVFNCNAPDTGNMEVLAKYGTLEQQQQWLVPLLRGEIASCFAMTEPDVASSDATNIQSSIADVGNGMLRLDGKKWWTTGACSPACRIAIFMGKTDSSAAPHRQQSMVLVPMDSPGVTVIRPLDVFGYDAAPHGHAEVHFENVRVPVDNLLLGRGRGFEIAQGRLGPGRLHHCMRIIGLGERGMELMAARAATRVTFGKAVSEQGAFVKELAQHRIQLDAARLTVLAAADALDKIGNKQARGQIAAAKVLAPVVVLAILDSAIQVHGGAGVCSDTPLAHLYAEARTLRIADGPDDVHLASIGRQELQRSVALSHKQSKL